jgi:hypothetical protein
MLGLRNKQPPNLQAKPTLLDVDAFSFLHQRSFKYLIKVSLMSFIRLTVQAHLKNKEDKDAQTFQLTFSGVPSSTLF